MKIDFARLDVYGRFNELLKASNYLLSGGILGEHAEEDLERMIEREEDWLANNHPDLYKNYYMPRLLRIMDRAMGAE